MLIVMMVVVVEVVMVVSGGGDVTIVEVIMTRLAVLHIITHFISTLCSLLCGLCFLSLFFIFEAGSCYAVLACLELTM